ncbi:TPA: type VI secretion system tip protein VgrG [Klebsiella aerogenes]|nr:type VI secretion system tip protein VgrG [Klebsiella aerogenes]
MTEQTKIIQLQDTLNRYLLYFPRSKSTVVDVHSFIGEETLSKPYRYTIRFSSADDNIPAGAALNQIAQFYLRAPNPNTRWQNEAAWLPVRQINGVITQFTRLKSSSDEALYECVLEHELALLDKNYRSAVYTDVTVPEVVTQLMKNSGYFKGYNIDFDKLSYTYPRREMIIQWKETDLQFIRRLLAEIGIWFRFENHHKVQTETVVIFADSDSRYIYRDKKLPYVRYSGMTSYDEYVTDLEEQHSLVPEQVLVRTYNYRDPYSPQAVKTIINNDIPEGITSGGEYHYADHYLADGDFHATEAETATFYARLRYERLLNEQSRLSATTSDPDRPFIAHVMHDGARPDLVTNRNDTRNIIRTAALNKIRLEDRRGKEHIKISTEHGKGQLNLGHLVDAEGKKRGEGLEARTDDWMALRAAKGVMITTQAQPRAQGQQLDMTAAITQLEKALSLAMTLQQSALTAGASNVDTDRQNTLGQTLNKLSGAALLTYGGQGQAHVTPESLQLSAGQDVITTAGRHASMNVMKKFSLAVGETLSLFARKLGIQMVAGAGDITTQAQRGAIHMLSQQDFTLTSTDGRLHGSARQGIQLVCGGGGIRISPDGQVEIFSPVGVDIKGPNLRYLGPESAQVQAPAFDKGTFTRRYQLHASDDPEQVLANRPFRLKSSTGEVLEGETDSNGCSPLLDSADLDSYKLEVL